MAERPKQAKVMRGKGVRGKGRPKGQLNRATVVRYNPKETAMEISQRLKVDPIAILLQFASNDHKALKCKPKDITLGMQRSAAEAVAPYIHARRRWVEVTGQGGGPIDTLITMTPDQRAAHKIQLEARLGKRPIDAQTIDVQAEVTDVKEQIVDAIIGDDDEDEEEGSLEDLL